MSTGWVVDAALAFLTAFDWFVLSYFVLLNTGYLVLLCLASLEFSRHLRRLPFAGYDETYASPLTLPVSVIVPAYNEGPGIVEAVRAMLALRYPEFEVLVIDDGSSDDTYERLAEAFDLVEVPRVVVDDVPVTGRILGVSIPRSSLPLVVVRKENGGKADALNTGINIARYPLVCMVDADSLLDPDALITVSKPFADDPEHVVATGGVVRAANGCTVVGGRVVDVRMPTTWLARIQVVEYLRAFLMGRTGWSRLGALAIISGAFGLFRRDILLEVGGLAHGCIGEDADLVIRIHGHLRRTRRPYRVVFVAEPVAWTEVPTSLKILATQRRRWHRGLAQTLWRNRSMMLNPRYGRIGLLTLPYYLVFELLAPLVEVVGVAAAVLGLAVGAVNTPFAMLFVAVALAYAILLSIASLALEEFSFHRYHRWRDLGLAVACAFIENLGYRQLTAVWRIQGLWAEIKGARVEWGTMSRQGFGGPADALAVKRNAVDVTTTGAPSTGQR